MKTHIKYYAKVYMLALFGGICGMANAQVNLLKNPYFEEWTNGLPDDWHFDEVAGAVSSTVYYGSYSVKQQVRLTRMWQQVEGIVGGQEYTLRYRYYDNDPDAKGRLWAYWTQGEEFLEEDAEILRPGAFSEDEDAWQEYFLELTAPEHADGFRFEVRTYDEGAGGGAVYYDHFELTGIPPPVDGGHETFDNLDLTGVSYTSGTFIGQDGSEWTYVECRGDYEIDGKAIMIGRNRTPQSNFYSGIIPNGVGRMSFDYMQAFATNVNLNVLVNDQVVATVTTDGQQGEVFNSGEIEVHIPGDVVFKFIGVTNSSGQVVIDNIIWNSYDESQVPEEVEVSSLAHLRAQASDVETIYALPGEAVITWMLPTENKFYLQDEGAGIILWDADGLLAEEYALYDGLSGIRGRLTQIDNMLYWILFSDPGEASSTGNILHPHTLTIDELAAHAGEYQAQLVRLQHVSFVGVAGDFEAGACYALSDGDDVLDFCAIFDQADYIGTAIPEDLLTITGLVGEHHDGGFITARQSHDIQDASSPSGFSVVFTVLDETETLKNINIAGDMTEWDFVAMLEDPDFNWSVTLNLAPGSYAWNAAGDNGTDPPFWLIPESHLNVTVGEDGHTTGDVSYVYVATGTSDIRLSVVKMYPNPAGTYLHIESGVLIERIRVLNVLGQEVYDEEGVNTMEYDLNVGQFVPGIYVVVVHTDEGTTTGKIQVEP